MIKMSHRLESEEEGEIEIGDDGVPTTARDHNNILRAVWFMPLNRSLLQALAFIYLLSLFETLHASDAVVKVALYLFPHPKSILNPRRHLDSFFTCLLLSLPSCSWPLSFPFSAPLFRSTNLELFFCALICPCSRSIFPDFHHMLFVSHFLHTSLLTPLPGEVLSLSTISRIFLIFITPTREYFENCVQCKWSSNTGVNFDLNPLTVPPGRQSYLIKDGDIPCTAEEEPTYSFVWNMCADVTEVSIPSICAADKRGSAIQYLIRRDNYTEVFYEWTFFYCFYLFQQLN